MPKVGVPPFRLLLAAGVLAFLAAGVLALPYHFAVPPSVSLSYVTGFDNHVAVLMFLLFGTAFVVVTKGVLPLSREGNRELPGWTLVALCAGMLAFQLAWRHHVRLLLGSETAYALERQMHLDRGERLYRDFEFVYGPLLIYPGHLATALLGLSARKGLALAVMSAWVLGAAMIWFVVAKTDLPARYRPAVLLLLLTQSMLGVPSDGMNYTPIRTYGAAALGLAFFLFWRRFRQPYATAVLGVLAVAVGLMLSPEQGISLAFGVTCYTMLLAWLHRRGFPLPAVGLLLVGEGVVFGLASHAGLFLSTRGFTQGGYNFPVLPSGPILLLLGTYLCGMGVLFGAFRERRLEQAAVPLVLCGLPLLSSALGRCDLGHIGGAIPLYVVAALSLAGRRWLFWCWLALVVYFMLPLRYFWLVARSHVHSATRPAVRAVAPEPGPAPGKNTIPVGKETIPQTSYFAPIVVPVGMDGKLAWPVESGYYFGLWNVITPASIQEKAEEISRKRAPLLLLPEDDHRLKISFWPSEEDVQQLHTLESAPWVPAAKHALPSTEAIRAVILRMYVPTDEAEPGWRVWKLR